MIKKAFISLRAFGWIGYVALALVVGALFHVLRKVLSGSSTSKDTERVKEYIQEKQTEIRIARTEAAVKITAARTEEASVQNELTDIAKMDDQKKRLEALVALKNRLR